MARVTVEECLDFVSNRFELVLVAAKRAHQLSSGGYKSNLDDGKDKPTVLALREIEAGIIDSSIINEEYAMEEELSAQAQAQDKARMDEVEAELSDVTYEESSETLSEVEEE